MNRPSSLSARSLLFNCWQEFFTRYRFKYVLPKITEAVLDGIRLDLSSLSLKVRNRILMGIYEAHEKKLCQEFLAPDDVVLELGSAIGFIGLICQKKIGIQRFFAFEANPNTLVVLRRNYELNGVQPTAWNLALGPMDGTLELDVASDFWENSVVPRDGQPRTTVAVPAASFRSILTRVERAVTALIIDVEGAEQFINLDEIPATVRKIILELHPKILGPEKTEGFKSGLGERGFALARSEESAFAFLR
jgi:FkbM family methyltransferase